MASSRRGPDRFSVALFSLAAFLVLLALLASQLSGGRHARPVPVVLRKVYRTTVIERVFPAGSGGRGGTSVSQSQSGVSGGLSASGLATRAS